jgi:hypothetical protein
MVTVHLSQRLPSTSLTAIVILCDGVESNEPFVEYHVLLPTFQGECTRFSKRLRTKDFGLRDQMAEFAKEYALAELQRYIDSWCTENKIPFINIEISESQVPTLTKSAVLGSCADELGRVRQRTFSRELKELLYDLPSRPNFAIEEL